MLGAGVGPRNGEEGVEIEQKWGQNWPQIVLALGFTFMPLPA